MVSIKECPGLPHYACIDLHPGIYKSLYQVVTGIMTI